MQEKYIEITNNFLILSILVSKYTSFGRQSKDSRLYECIPIGILCVFNEPKPTEIGRILKLDGILFSQNSKNDVNFKSGPAWPKF